MIVLAHIFLSACASIALVMIVLTWLDRRERIREAGELAQSRALGLHEGAQNLPRASALSGIDC